MTLTELARVTGIDRSHLRRIESGAASPSVDALIAIGLALGADLGLRYFPGSGPRLIDRFQAPMIEAFIRALDPRWTVRLEIPVATPARGVVDAALADRISPARVAAEFQSEFRRVEREVRWNNEKAEALAVRLTEEERMGPLSVSSLLVLRSTVATREIARRFEATLGAAFPSRTRDAVRSFTTESAPWPGAAVVWMRVERGKAELLDGPPRGVRLGR